MAGSLLSNHHRVASLLLRHTHKLPMLEVGQNGSLPDLDGVMAATVRCFAADGGLAGAGGWESWGGDLLYDALEMSQHKTAAALLGSGAQLPTPAPLRRQDEEAAAVQGQGQQQGQQQGRQPWQEGRQQVEHQPAQQHGQEGQVGHQQRQRQGCHPGQQGRQEAQQRQQETQQRQQEGQPAQQEGQLGHQPLQQRQQEKQEEKQQGQQGRSSLHVLAESRFAWGR